MRLGTTYNNFEIGPDLNKPYVQNGATVQHIHSIQVIATICPKQKLGILQASKQHATASQHKNKTWT